LILPASRGGSHKLQEKSKDPTTDGPPTAGFLFFASSFQVQKCLIRFSQSCGNRIPVRKDSRIVLDAPMASNEAILNHIKLLKCCSKCNADQNLSVGIPNVLIVFAPSGVGSSFVSRVELPNGYGVDVSEAENRLCSF
jgi:hypothetical protein